MDILFITEDGKELGEYQLPYPPELNHRIYIKGANYLVIGVDWTLKPNLFYAKVTLRFLQKWPE